MIPGDRRPSKDMRQAHCDRIIQQAREAPTPMEIAAQDLAGQRRDRVDKGDEQTPQPTKQVRTEEIQGKQPVEPQLGTDLEQLYIENDSQAYALDRTLEKNRRFYFQKKHAQEEAQLYEASKKKSDDNSATRIKLTAPNNKHPFLEEHVVHQVVTTLQDVDFDIKPEDVVVTSMSATGPYIVALDQEAAEYLLEEGMMLIDPKHNPPVTQFFTAKRYNTTLLQLNTSSTITCTRNKPYQPT